MIPSSYDGQRPQGQNSPAESPQAGAPSQPKTAGAEGSGAGLRGRRGSAPGVVLGVDPNLKACALVAVPLDWAGDWGRVVSRTTGYSLPQGATDRQRVQRLERLGAAVVAFAMEHDCTTAWLEGYPFGKSEAAFSLGEASGAIRVALHVAGVDVRTAPISTARKLLLGYVPRTGAKLAVRDRLVALGASLPSFDAYDAATAALYGLRQLGGFAFQAAP